MIKHYKINISNVPSHIQLPYQRSKMTVSSLLFKSYCIIKKIMIYKS